MQKHLNTQNNRFTTIYINTQIPWFAAREHCPECVIHHKRQHTRAWSAEITILNFQQRPLPIWGSKVVTLFVQQGEGCKVVSLSHLDCPFTWEKQIGHDEFAFPFWLFWICKRQTCRTESQKDSFIHDLVCTGFHIFGDLKISSSKKQWSKKRHSWVLILWSQHTIFQPDDSLVS